MVAVTHITPGLPSSIATRRRLRRASLSTTCEDGRGRRPRPWGERETGSDATDSLLGLDEGLEAQQPPCVMRRCTLAGKQKHQGNPLWAIKELSYSWYDMSYCRFSQLPFSCLEKTSFLQPSPSCQSLLSLGKSISSRRARTTNSSELNHLSTDINSRYLDVCLTLLVPLYPRKDLAWHYPQMEEGTCSVNHH